MKKLLLAMSALAALSLLVPSTGVAQTALGPNGWYNHIGIYTAEDPLAGDIYYNGPAGLFTVYVVCTNPRNYNFGAPTSGVEQNISLIGGMEFRVNMPSYMIIQEAVMPPNSINFATPPEWLAGVEAPVVDFHCTLLRLTLASFVTTPGYIYLTPVQEAPQSVPGAMAITDYNDDFRLQAAFPASGDYSLPVFGLWQTTGVVPTEDASWSQVHSLYR